MAARSFSDQMGYTVSLDSPPQRIVSLVPSQTELLADLGLDATVKGITKFCVHPTEWRSRKVIVGGTKNFHFDVIEKLNPDLILGNKEENYREGIERLRMHYPVWMSDIVTFQDTLSMIKSIGLLTGKEAEAAQYVEDISVKFQRIKRYNGQSVLYLIWQDPWMAAGGNTFIDSMLDSLGLKNILDSTARYPSLTATEIKKLKPQFIFLSSEPFPFKQKHADDLHLITPSSKILFVDGEMFSWYGSRLAKAPDYFNTLVLD